jgi:hypothetical protein
MGSARECLSCEYSLHVVVTCAQADPARVSGSFTGVPLPLPAAMQSEDENAQSQETLRATRPLHRATLCGFHSMPCRRVSADAARAGAPGRSTPGWHSASPCALSCNPLVGSTPQA